MERDFMGLNSNATVVKEEALEPVFSISSDVRWPFSNGFEAFNNHQPGEIQNAHFLQLHHDNKQAVPFNTSSPFFRHHCAGADASVNPQLIGGVPFRLILPSTTQPWYGSKAVSVPAQLTIFYGGMVNVYDDISPQKAEAIMLLAGKGAFVAAANGPQPRGQATGDMNHPQPCSPVSSPISVSSPPVANEYGASTTSVTKMETLRVMSSFIQARQSAVPQARKASLARFLEKRKERVMAASVPYHLDKNSIAVIVASKQRV